MFGQNFFEEGLSVNSEFLSSHSKSRIGPKSWTSCGNSPPPPRPRARYRRRWSWNWSLLTESGPFQLVKIHLLVWEFCVLHSGKARESTNLLRVCFPTRFSSAWLRFQFKRGRNSSWHGVEKTIRTVCIYFTGWPEDLENPSMH